MNLSSIQERAMNDLPIESVPGGSPLPKDKGKMYWFGQSQEEYPFVTIRALVRKGLLQCTDVNNVRTMVKKEEKHNNPGWERYNSPFL